MTNNPKHFADLATDGEYLRKIASSVNANDISMDIDFALLTDALAAFGLDELYSLVTKDSIQSDQVQTILDLWFERITTGAISVQQQQKMFDMWEYLAEDDVSKLQPADILFVFGGPETVKAHKAVDLYKKGLAPKIIFTGDTQRALVHLPHVSESVRDATIARAAGIPDEAILIDDKSITTPQNVENALKLLMGIEPFPTSFILVNLPWYLRRATNTFHTYWHQAPLAASRVQRVNAGSEQYTAANYFLHRRGLEYVVFEYLKIKQARDMKHM